jgi:hypothetical protein
MTTEQLQAWLNTPLAMFILMLLASIVSAWKQIGDANRNGAEITWGAYFAHAPETVTMLLTNVIGFAVLVYSNQLNFAAALGLGWVSNSAADLIRSGGRSSSLVNLSAVSEDKK